MTSSLEPGHSEKETLLQNSRERTSHTSLIRPRSLSLTAGAFTVLLTALTPSLTETAVANGETRTIYLYHTHTHEQIVANYLVDGHYDQAVLKQLNWFLRDWRRDEPTSMDPRLFDVVWEAYRQAGASEPINVVSAYRSPATNAMLRSRSRGVAKFSQHMLGKAMDTAMPGMPMARIREIGMRMQRGGVGYYPTSGTPFVHLDVGSVRSWPRMSYDQLARLFPDGKTVHLPANGQQLARYDEARAEIEARGGGAYVPVERKGKSFLAFLFGGGSGEEDEDGGTLAPPPSSRKQWASLAPRDSRPGRVATADAGEERAPLSDENGRRGRFDAIARAESDLPRGETTLGPGPDADARAGQGDKAIAVAAPLPPERPAALEQPANVAVAALEQTGDDGKGAGHSAANLPLPPRRPASLTAMNVPLPPVRPVELASLASRPAAGAVPSSTPIAVKAKELSSGFDVTGTTPLGGTGQAALRATFPGSEPKDAKGAKVGPLLAYAPAVSTQSSSLEDHGGAPASLRAFASMKSSAAKSAVLRGFVPARLDRSNFRIMTGPLPASQVSGGSVLGSAISAPRSAARAERSYLAAAPGSNYVSTFAAQASAPPTDRFAKGR